MANVSYIADGQNKYAIVDKGGRELIATTNTEIESDELVLATALSDLEVSKASKTDLESAKTELTNTISLATQELAKTITDNVSTINTTIDNILPVSASDVSLSSSKSLSTYCDEQGNLVADTMKVGSSTVSSYILSDNTIDPTKIGQDTTHNFVTDTEKSTWTNKQAAISDLATIRSNAALGATAYQKPATGIPSSDLSSDVQASLTKADTALQAHQDITGKADKTTTVNGHALSSNVTVTKSDVGLSNVTNDAQVKRSEMGKASGVATLDSNGLVPSSQLPSYVDDVLEYTAKSSFPATGETGKIYVDTTTNLTYRWSGSQYIEISPSLALGTTASTAFPGDRGLALENNTYTKTEADDNYISKFKYMADDNIWNIKSINRVITFSGEEPYENAEGKWDIRGYKLNYPPTSSYDASEQLKSAITVNPNGSIEIRSRQQDDELIKLNPQIKDEELVKITVGDELAIHHNSQSDKWDEASHELTSQENTNVFELHKKNSVGWAQGGIKLESKGDIRIGAPTVTLNGNALLLNNVATKTTTSVKSIHLGATQEAHYGIIDSSNNYIADLSFYSPLNEASDNHLKFAKGSPTYIFDANETSSSKSIDGLIFDTSSDNGFEALSHSGMLIKLNRDDNNYHDSSNNQSVKNTLSGFTIQSANLGTIYNISGKGNHDYKYHELKNVGEISVTKNGSTSTTISDWFVSVDDWVDDANTASVQVKAYANDSVSQLDLQTVHNGLERGLCLCSTGAITGTASNLTYNGSALITQKALDTTIVNYLPLTGGTLTGDLTVGYESYEKTVLDGESLKFYYNSSEIAGINLIDITAVIHAANADVLDIRINGLDSGSIQIQGGNLFADNVYSKNFTIVSNDESNIYADSNSNLIVEAPKAVQVTAQSLVVNNITQGWYEGD